MRKTWSHVLYVRGPLAHPDTRGPKGSSQRLHFMAVSLLECSLCLAELFQ